MSKNLFGGTEVTTMTSGVLLKANTAFKIGSILGKTTEVVGEEPIYDLVTSSMQAEYILANDVETGSSSEYAVVYKTGVFNHGMLTVGADDTIEAHADELRKYNIHIKVEV